MKKFFNSWIFFFILGALIFGTMSAAFAYSYTANNISYSAVDGWSPTNVETAINKLRAKITNYDKMEFMAFNHINQTQTFLTEETVALYGKITVTNKTLYTGTYCYLRFYNNDGSKYMDLNLNYDYDLTSLYNQGYVKLSVLSDEWCWVTYTLHN